MNTSYIASVSKRLRFLFFLPGLFLLMLSACASTPDASTVRTYTGPSMYTPVSTAANPVGSAMDSRFIPVKTSPDIVVKSENAALLTFVASDAQQNISTSQFSLPYKKEGNKVTIDFGEAVVQNLEIKVPRRSNLTLIMNTGNVIVDSIQGQVTMTLASGTIQLKNFAPRGTNTITTKSGTINVTFAATSSCNIKAQTGFGAIVSHYAAISEVRNGMQAKASGAIGNGSGASVNLVGEYGSITFGPQS